MTPRSPSAFSGSAAVISAAARRSMLKLPIRLTRMTVSKSARSIGPSRPTIRLAGAIPAQLTSRRQGPWVALAFLTTASAVAASLTSQARPSPPISFATASAVSRLRSITPTRAPAAARARAVAAPMPEPPPVTRAPTPLTSIEPPPCCCLTSGRRAYSTGRHRSRRAANTGRSRARVFRSPPDRLSWRPC